MVKLLALLFACLLFFPSALAERAISPQAGEAYFPSENDWTYHFVYAYPHIQGEDYASAAINDTYQMALDEMLHLILPMFAHEENMRFDGKNEVQHDFSVARNDEKLLSILQYRRQSMGEEGEVWSIEPLTFDLLGDYIGETLTLRGVALVAAGVPNDQLDEAAADEFPAWARLINGSSDLLSQALLPRLYQEFTALQQSGVCRADLDQAGFEGVFSPATDFYADPEGRIVFFFQPELLSTPSFDVPTFPFAPEELENIL